ncbi:hypothetical protein LCGC14_2916570 [marine sediment metagenome]|uniref:Uncharacterized protein n=1 Tax=marine sediment metagenome TaxID=412755 RepID=A0A0F8YBW3_9ZZZZ
MLDEEKAKQAKSIIRRLKSLAKAWPKADGPYSGFWLVLQADSHSLQLWDAHPEHGGEIIDLVRGIPVEGIV